ncbi:hypothetical protein PV364_09840 [Streptomyces sp. MI02-7b]|nr:hypothetical protein [Streptomyces sp. MI02-7b]MDX3072691.1 hypothetical protein [Streptomyces sp. MI02-7b]
MNTAAGGGSCPAPANCDATTGDDGRPVDQDQAPGAVAAEEVPVAPERRAAQGVSEQGGVAQVVQVHGEPGDPVAVGGPLRPSVAAVVQGDHAAAPAESVELPGEPGGGLREAGDEDERVPGAVLQIAQAHAVAGEHSPSRTVASFMGHLARRVDHVGAMLTP